MDIAGTQNNMETMIDAIARMRAEGFGYDFAAVDGARLRCLECGRVVSTDAITVFHTVRFEGNSNPDDEAILLAVAGPCGHHGVFTGGYGPTADPDTSEVLSSLH